MLCIGDLDVPTDRRVHQGLAVLIKLELRDSVKRIEDCLRQTFMAIETEDWRIIGVYLCPGMVDAQLLQSA